MNNLMIEPFGESYPLRTSILSLTKVHDLCPVELPRESGWGTVAFAHKEQKW